MAPRIRGWASGRHFRPIEISIFVCHSPAFSFLLNVYGMEIRQIQRIHNSIMMFCIITRSDLCLYHRFMYSSFEFVFHTQQQTHTTANTRWPIS